MIGWTTAIDALRDALKVTFDVFPPAHIEAGAQIEHAFCRCAYETVDVALTNARFENFPTAPQYSNGAAAQPKPAGWERAIEVLETNLMVCFGTLSPEHGDEAFEIGKAFESLVAQTLDEVSRHGGLGIFGISRTWGIVERARVRL